ncbi:uncharacterized protein G2W53_031716 [Senna tora]|uniref:Uncharacterized protein n=1 Tax=Senna tora TaxID=362788 RepID=A0A834W5P9_9FABA|nr:uncharacterized protein G2W53_031716 [Senna tora]
MVQFLDLLWDSLDFPEDLFFASLWLCRREIGPIIAGIEDESTFRRDF